MKTGDAIEHLKTGKRVARSGWNYTNVWLEIVKANGVCSSYIAMSLVGNTLVPYVFSNDDIMAEDWLVV